MNTQKQYKVSAILSYLTILINVCMGLAFTPALKNAFGDGFYGVYGGMGKFVGYMTIMDLGLGNAVIRYVAKYRAEKDQAGMERFLGMVMTLYVLIGAVIWIIGMVCYANLPAIYPKYSPEEMALAKNLFLLVMGNLTLSMLLNIFPGTMTAHERFVFMRVVTVIRLAARVVLLVLLLRSDTNPFQVTLLDSCLNLVVMLCYVWYVFFRLRIRVRWGGFDPVLLKQIFSYSIFIFLNMVMQEIYWNVDATLVGILKGAKIATITLISGSIVTYFMDFSNAISGMFLPKAVQMVTKGADGEALTDLMIRVGRLQLMIIALLVVGFSLVGRQFFALWTGPETADTYYIIVLMQMLALLIPMFQNVAISITQAMNKHAFRAVVLAFISLLNIALSYVLIQWYGPVGAAVGTVFSLILGNTLISNWYYHRKIGLNIPRFFQESLRGILPALLLTMAVCALLFTFMPQTSWMWLLARIALIAAVYAASMYFFGMNGAEKAMVTGVLHRAKKGDPR